MLDRDGVLNRMVVDGEHGTIDSPLHPDQVELLPAVPEALTMLANQGWQFAIVTNQPSAAKKKTTLANLEATHARVLSLLGAQATHILSSQICFHRQEDGCDCRKPKPGMLDAVFRQHPQFDRAASWMVGDGVTDLEAGLAAGVRTAYLGPRKCDAYKILEERRLVPDFHGPDLLSFARHLQSQCRPLQT